MIDLRVGDCREILPTLPAESVHCCVTSPPYWGLRDYQHPRQIGLEAKLSEHVAAVVDVFREVKRVLRPEGTLWLNVGDSYASSGGAGWQGKHGTRANRTHTQRALKGVRHLSDGLKPKDLIGLPWRIALALQADGWFLRSDIIWAKPNPMPESVRDRPTKSHEYLFLFSRSRRYFYNAKAIREKATWVEPNAPDKIKSPHGQGYSRRARTGGKPTGWAAGPGAHSILEHNQAEREPHKGRVPLGLLRNKRSVWTIATTPTLDSHFATFPRKLVEPCILAGCPPGGTVLDPFAGTGTVGRVAEDLGRHSLLIELSASYAAMAARKTAQLGLVP